jgi:antitoxin component of MazEF toxin-antitoxin module
MSKRSIGRNYSNSFPFFDALKLFYLDNRGKIRRSYKDLTKKYLDHNDISINPNAFLRKPQFEALEMYIFLKEFMDNKKVHEIFSLWKDKMDMFSDRSYYSSSENRMNQVSMYEAEIENYDEVFQFMKDNASDYPNYIYALTMGVGKTILMATCIFYEFLLASKYPKDSRFCHNALVFAPDKTVRQSLKEIQTFERNKVIPSEYASVLNANIKFHFLDDDSSTLNAIDGSNFNLIISNTQKIILKTKRTEFTPLEKLMNMSSKSQENLFSEIDDFYSDLDEIKDEKSVITNQRFEKLKRLKQIGIYVDEAHHMFGKELQSSLQDKKSKTSLRNTINELANELEKKGTKVVACYNYTGTPYVNNSVLPDVVSYYGLKQAIDEQYLKTVKIQGYENVKDITFLSTILKDFFDKHKDKTYEDLPPKLAIFGSTIDEIINHVKPAVEEILANLGISLDKILVNVGDERYTKDNDINDFNNLDIPGTNGSSKQVILLVGKGKEGWNCRSLFGVALYRKPNSTIFVLQSTMRCLRQITSSQQEGNVYLSKENFDILDKELAKNFKISIKEVNSAKSDKIQVYTKVIPPMKRIRLSQIKHHYELVELNNLKPINFNLSNLDIEKYKPKKFEKSDLTGKQTVKEIEITTEQRTYSLFELVFEVSRYLNINPLKIEKLLKESIDGSEKILNLINQYNEIVFHELIPKIFKYFYDVKYTTESISKEVELINSIGKDEFEFFVKPDLLITNNEPSLSRYKDKSFHVDKYCFDSKPELELFLQYIKNQDIKEIYFTGMFTGKSNGLTVQYIDPESNIVRNYYPDFIALHKDGHYEIIEVKGDNMIDDRIVEAKFYAALELAEDSNMQYNMYKSSDIMKKGLYLD